MNQEQKMKTLLEQINFVFKRFSSYDYKLEDFTIESLSELKKVDEGWYQLKTKYGIVDISICNDEFDYAEYTYHPECEEHLDAQNIKNLMEGIDFDEDEEESEEDDE